MIVIPLQAKRHRTSQQSPSRSQLSYLHLHRRCPLHSCQFCQCRWKSEVHGPKIKKEGWISVVFSRYMQFPEEFYITKVMLRARLNEWSLSGLQEGFSVLSYTNALVIVYNRKKYLTILIYKWILNFIYSKKKAFSLKLQIYNNHRAKLQLTTWKI